MKKTLLLVSLLTLWCSSPEAAPSESSKDIKLNPANCEIVAPKDSPVVEYAIVELNKHIKLITGQALKVSKERPKSGKFPIYVGIRPRNDKKRFEEEEARYLITPQGIWLYGKDRFKNKSDIPAMDIALSSSTQAGTLFAVYEFLENELGIKWIEPGDEGIVCKEQETLTLTPREGGWVPQLAKRHMRTAYKDKLRSTALNRGNIPKDMQFSDAEFAQRQQEENIWRGRMRMGANEKFTYGHAFTKWWAKYGKTNPEYFALNKNGKRSPISNKRADRIKMCVSNPALAKQVVAEQMGRNKNLQVINACENDSRDFCNCPKCKALDVRLPGEENFKVDDAVLTDRYIHFTNAVLREAKKINPDVKTVFYAYSRYHIPPRRERLDDGVITFLLPNLMMSEKEMDEYYNAWKNANAKETYLRPNDLCQDTALPLGFEKHMFTKFKKGDQILDIKGTDYDTCWGFWPVSGITNYIMARAFYRPKQSFEYWENEYYQSFGKAANDVRQYYHYWRQIWEQRVMKNQERITQIAPIKLLRTKMTFVTDLLYSETDFDTTDTFLKNGLKNEDLSASEKNRLEKLLLANEHNRLKYRAMSANIPSSIISDEQRKATTQALYNFRRKHRMDLNMHWELVFYLENLYEDNAGFKRLLGTEESKQRDYRLETVEKMKAARDSNEPLR